jgi:outer membrane protein
MMNMHTSWNKWLGPAIFILGSTFTIEAQQQIITIDNDTLGLNDIINTVIQNNPVIKQSGELIVSSELNKELVKSAYLPTVEFNSSLSRMAPTPTIDIPQLGHFQMAPDNSMNIAVEARQLIYDFGKTSTSVSISEANREMANLTSEQIKEKYALASAGIFYSLVYIQTAKNIVADHLNTLKKHLEFVENKQITGSATGYEILSTKVRLSSAETQLTELQTNYEVELSHLSTIMGTKLNRVVFRADTSIYQVPEPEDTTFVFALSHRYDMQLMDKKKWLASLNYKAMQRQNTPSLGLLGTGGFKNGYLPDIEKLKANFMAGLSLKVPIFEGNRKNIKLKIAESSINQVQYESENSERIAYDEINASFLSLQLAKKKIEQSGLQFMQAREAYEHAEVNFREGVITNLDLIVASDMLSESQLQLLKNKIDYQYNLLKYKTAIGEPIF